MLGGYGVNPVSTARTICFEVGRGDRLSRIYSARFKPYYTGNESTTKHKAKLLFEQQLLLNCRKRKILTIQGCQRSTPAD